KSDEDGKPYPGLVEKTAEKLRLYKLENRAVLHSFDINVVHEIAEKAPEFKRLISVNQAWAEKQGGIENFIKNVSDLVDVIGIHHELFEAEFERITALVPLSKVSVWTLNDPELMRKWSIRQPLWLVSDNPVQLREVMNESKVA